MKISDAVFFLVDTETTRRDAADPEQELVEFAAWATGNRVEFQGSTLVQPTRTVPPEVSGIHHLTDEDLVDAPTRLEFDLWLAETMQLGGPLSPEKVVPVAHNAAFDRAILDIEVGRGLLRPDWLCTERLAHHLVPEAPNFKLATLRYLFGHRKISTNGLDLERGPHAALYDVRVLHLVFFSLLDRYEKRVAAHYGEDRDGYEAAMTVEMLLKFAARPYVIARMPFGKHFGKPLDEIELDYFKWMLRTMTDLSPDLRWNAEQQIKARSQQEKLFDDGP